MTQPLHTTPTHTKATRHAIDRAARLAISLQLAPTVETLEEIEAALSAVNGQIAQIRRAHHLRVGWDQARAAARGRGPAGPAA